MRVERIAKARRRRVLVISRDERVGKWFRFVLGGLNRGLPTTVVSDLGSALRALKRLRPRVVILVEESPEKTDDRLMLLEALLLLEKQSRENTLAILYSPADGQLRVYHSVYRPSVNREDVAEVVLDSLRCPLFGCEEEEVPGFPKDCRFLPLLLPGEALGAGRSKAAAQEQGAG